MAEPFTAEEVKHIVAAELRRWQERCHGLVDELPQRSARRKALVELGADLGERAHALTTPERRGFLLGVDQPFADRHP